MTITITRDVVEHAKQRDSSHCMIADAIREKTGAKYVLVDVQSIRLSNMRTRKRYTFLTPPIAQQAIIAFDQGKPIKPFSFSLRRAVTVRAVQHVRRGTVASAKRARATYEKTHGKRAAAVRDSEGGAGIWRPIVGGMTRNRGRGSAYRWTSRRLSTRPKLSFRRVVVRRCFERLRRGAGGRARDDQHDI